MNEDYKKGDQEKIWDYFQVEYTENFKNSMARMNYLFRKSNKFNKILNIGIGGGILKN